MDVLIWILTAIHVVVAVITVMLVLMQKSQDQGVGAAFAGSVTETVFGGSITPLVKMTIYCGVVLLITTLSLAVLHSHRHRAGGGGTVSKILQQSAPPVVPLQPVAPTEPVAPSAPAN